MRIDLHTHSTVSDGTQPPAEVVAAAVEAGLDVVALTDHDSAAGWGEAAGAARRLGITLVPGAEISCQWRGVSVHLLSYLHDPEHPGLLGELTRARSSRERRAERMVELIDADYALTWDDVAALAAPGATLGRPHIADALVARGHVATRDEAFTSILATGSPYFVGHYAPDPVVAVELVRAAGGVPVFAHPKASRRGYTVGDHVIEAMVAAGLAGLEVDHRDHSEPDRARLREIAASHDLIVTGSSDYHGTGKQNRLGENGTSPADLERIEAEGKGHVIRP
ncbi:MAG TPA: PHP domain-containing protein [Actinomycetales bacterium]|nr:PHP domain-containing protein [Actinomycetales bacterium]